MLPKLGPPFAFSLWVAARVLLVHGSTLDHPAIDPTIHPLIATLREMGRAWNVAARYASLLQRVLDEYRDSARAPVPATGFRETPGTLRILADMRRCAYDLDFLISRQPRQVFGAVKQQQQQQQGKTTTTTGTAMTPARTPGVNELEYLDVFDFFNLPRVGGEHGLANLGAGGGEDQAFVDYQQHLEANAGNDWLVQ
jgi:hypothetical protein